MPDVISGNPPRRSAKRKAADYADRVLKGAIPALAPERGG